MVMKKVIRLTEGDLVRIVKKVLEEQRSDSDIRRLNQLRQNIEKKYPNMCKGLDIPLGGNRYRMDVKLGKNLPFDPEVKEMQLLYNKMYPDNKVTVDGIVGPQMRGLFCIPS